ncbi:Eco57I restriction-modification methylase domain-containing protein [Photobacterium damselae]|uniref:Eco57I restriction-modification methylase domain-containing protein n=1 Tax=Photobacterium damselae TaxID=38293 RepID=UPI0018A36C80|nr:DNA methyltransferase [Photobacterium damselae]QOQ68160.1 N-6 DNA methylase [Photobacterium damselae subsp. damselae]
MRQPLDKALRKKLEDTVVKARDIVENAVNEALQRLGVAEAQAPAYLSEEERNLRRDLRAHARQLGDKLQDGKQEIERLTNEMAYEHWHRMLFARYLEQNNLLMYDEHTPVTLEECFELAEEESDCKDGWELAGRLAQKMLPQIFRADSPVFKLKLSINRVNELEELIAKLDPATYQAQDSLGWCYQFWQTKKKEQVNKSGVKIGAQELSPVTQLFTEPYMVSFLLDNALGAWWANKRLSQDDLIRANNEQELRELAAIPGVPLEYLRFSKDEDAGLWKPAAGGFEKWPEHLSELKTLDPCCGSGHFLVAVFLMLVPMRMQLEGLSAKQAVDAVLRDNIHGLELDQRCIELAAFALALEAWRYPNAGGYRALPELQLACSGMSIAEAQKEWKDLAKGDEALTDAIAWMQHTFKDAPTLGSLIDPTRTLKESQIPPWEILLTAIANNTNVTNETQTKAKGLAASAHLLSKQYDLVLTNPPYLGDRKQSITLKKGTEECFPIAKNELANVMYMKSSCLLKDNGSGLFVYPESWLTLARSEEFRQFVLSNQSLHFIGRLGDNSFESKQAQGASVCITIFSKYNELENEFASLDLFKLDSIQEKKIGLKCSELNYISQNRQLGNPQARIILSGALEEAPLIESKAIANQGIKTGDDSLWRRNFWEIERDVTTWSFFQSTVSQDVFYGGRSDVINWSTEGQGMIRPRKGNKSVGMRGVAISQMGSLPCTIYTGELYDSNVAPIVPFESSDVEGFWSYFTSEKFELELRKIDSKKSITNATFLKVPFLAPPQVHSLPQPFTDDPTQWIFHGHPCASVIWDEESKTTAVGHLRQDESVLQVAVARLLGYQWPTELDPDMELAPEMREVMKKNADFAGLIDEDGIVCIPAVRGEYTAAKRLEAILHKAYGSEWTSSVESKLLKSVKAKDLESWLRDKFFEQHAKMFQHRPFIWQIWDGQKDGFSALVNYHKFDYKGLERLIYTYLDDWISIQKCDLAEGKDGADILLNAAENLKTQLVAILGGEKGLDIFVRWKPLAEQPIGWNPDLNDGVRLNIRPFMLAQDMGKKDAGVLRAKPNIHWKKDRGSDVESAPWFHLGLQYGGKEGDRINEHHLSLAEKRKAREEANE